MPFRSSRGRGRKSKFVTKRGLPFQMMKYVETKNTVVELIDSLADNPSVLSVNNISLVNIREGAGQFERIGSMIQVTGIHVKIIFKGVNNNDLRFLRVGLWTPRIPDATNQPFTNMVDQPDTDTHIMWFDKVAIAPLAEASTPGGVMTIKKKFKPYLKTIYQTNLGDSVTKGMLRLILLPKADLSVTFSYSVKTYFKDL